MTVMSFHRQSLKVALEARVLPCVLTSLVPLGEWNIVSVPTSQPHGEDSMTYKEASKSPVTRGSFRKAEGAVLILVKCKPEACDHSCHVSGDPRTERMSPSCP